MSFLIGLGDWCIIITRFTRCRVSQNRTPKLLQSLSPSSTAKPISNKSFTNCRITKGVYPSQSYVLDRQFLSTSSSAKKQKGKSTCRTKDCKSDVTNEKCVLRKFRAGTDCGPKRFFFRRFPCLGESVSKPTAGCIFIVAGLSHQ